MNLQHRVVDLLSASEAELQKLKKLAHSGGVQRCELTAEEIARLHTSILQGEFYTRTCAMLKSLHDLDWENIGRAGNHVAEKLAGLEEEYFAAQRAYQAFTKDMVQYFKK